MQNHRAELMVRMVADCELSRIEAVMVRPQRASNGSNELAAPVVRPQQIDFGIVTQARHETVVTEAAIEDYLVDVVIDTKVGDGDSIKTTQAAGEFQG